MRETPEKLNTQAIELAQQGNYTEAIACFKRALSLERHNHLLWYNLGITYRDAGDLTNARIALERAYEINDEDDDIVETLAVTCFHMGDYVTATEYCTDGLATNSDNAHLWNLLGVINFNRDEYALAAESFEQAITINPYYYDALYNLRDAYAELGNKAGVAMCEQQMRHISPSGKNHA
ncbi:MAG: tetratricopeptide repeat protein [Treponema sp.]|nr:tetratricopeptide repeat protein [Treponema sp.]